MKTLMAAALLAGLFQVAPAHAEPCIDPSRIPPVRPENCEDVHDGKGAPDGGCGFATATDNAPEAPEDSATGVLYGGPIAQNGTLTCTIKVNVGTHTGPYVNGASRSATGTNGTTILSPGVVSYISPGTEPVYLCDQFKDAGGTTRYWDGDADVWTTSSAVNCELAISAGTGDPILDPINDLIDTLDALLQSVGQTLDAVICPVLATLQGDYAGIVTINAQGDVFIAGDPYRDCPPYDLFG
jgi:hypothetical protein